MSTEHTTEVAWNAPLVDECEGAVCACGHVVLGHAWHGCEECPCPYSAIRALMSSGAVQILSSTPAQESAR